MQLYLYWIPYVFGIIEPKRYYDLMMETAQAERILPPWPGVRGRPIPTTESTYRMAFMILVTIISTVAVLTSEKITRRLGQVFIFFVAIFTFLPLVQYWTSGMTDTALLLAPIYTNVYGMICFAIIFWRTRDRVEKQQEKPKKD